MALNFLQKTLNKFEEYTFLDNGCGNGHDIAYLSFHLNNLIMHGIDISLKAVEDAIQLNSNKSNFTFECKNWKELNDTQHDIIYSSGVYHFFKFTEREAFISKIKKFLKTRGFIFSNHTFLK